VAFICPTETVTHVPTTALLAFPALFANLAAADTSLDLTHYVSLLVLRLITLIAAHLVVWLVRVIVLLAFHLPTAPSVSMAAIYPMEAAVCVQASALLVYQPLTALSVKVEAF
jgi:hypothetical protein